MVKVTHLRVVVMFLVVMGIALSLAGCGSSDGGTPSVQNAITISYTFPILPITFSFDTNGHISISGAATLVTELGEVAVRVGSVMQAFSVPDNTILLIIRHKQDGNLVDTRYQINTGGVGSADFQGNINHVKVGG